MGEDAPADAASRGSVGDVRLRDVTEADLPILFEQHRDPDANRMAAFTFRDPNDREVFMAHWARILADPQNVTQAILADGRVAGNIASFPRDGKREVGYWLGREYWGRGIATRALAAFLRHVTERPLYAGAAKDNLGSLRVLQKCGFVICDEGKEFSNARGTEVEEYLLVLEAPPAVGDEG